MSYPVGSRPRVTATFTDANGVVYDPPDVTFVARDPTGAETTYVFSNGQVTRASTGAYFIDVDTTDKPGPWYIRAFSPVGASEAATFDLTLDIVPTQTAATTSVLLTVEQFREHVTTGLSDAALQRLLDDARDAIIAWAGDGTSVTEILGTAGPKLILSRPAQSVVSITERRGTTDTTLATDDWQLYPGGYVLERMTGGTNSSSYWRGRVTVTYVPVDDVATRKMVQLDLVKLAIASEPALASRTIGAFSESFRADADPEAQRSAILSRLVSAPRMLVVGG